MSRDRGWISDYPSHDPPERSDRTTVGSWAHTADGLGRRNPGRPSGRGARPSFGSAIEWEKPFARLALAHALSVGGDAVVAIALANSLFFSADPGESRTSVLLYLVFTMAPFALVSPLLGPLMDKLKGGHRLVILLSIAGRALLAFAMVREAGGGILLFPEAFTALVLGKTYAVAKSSMVPSTVNSDSELVEANSKLQLLSGLAGFALGVPAGLLSLIGSGWVLAFAGVIFTGGALAAFRIAPGKGSLTEEAHEHGAELEGVNSAVVRVASSAMSWLRAVVGLVTFMLAFVLRSKPPAPPVGASVGLRIGFIEPSIRVGTPPEVSSGHPTWYFGVVVAASVFGGLLGSAVAPRLRAAAKEERIMFGSLLGAVAAGFCGLLFQGLLGMTLLALLIALSAGIAKQAFDALVQAGAPDANRGRLFARFEARFQVVWVFGALVAVIFQPSVTIGALLVFVGSILAFVTYRVGWQRSGGLPPPRQRSSAFASGVMRRDELVGGAKSMFSGLWNLSSNSQERERDPESER